MSGNIFNTFSTITDDHLYFYQSYKNETNRCIHFTTIAPKCLSIKNASMILKSTYVIMEET